MPQKSLAAYDFIWGLRTYVVYSIHNIVKG